MRIALTYTGRVEKHTYYVDWLKRNNNNVDIIKFSAEDDNLAEIPTCDGLVLSGGIDISPTLYRGAIAYEGAPEKFNERRDAFEMAAFQSALKNHLPVLAICRGMQLINIVCNGTLVQDLGDDYLNAIHTGNPDKYHAVKVASDTLLYKITGQFNGTINSGHHQALDKVGEGLMVNSRAPDGTIEGIEWEQKAGRPFMLGVQWHPERMFEHRESPLSVAIRDHFIVAVHQSMLIKHDNHKPGN